MNAIKITVYGHDAYTKAGKLKKRANPLYSRTLGDCDDITDKTMHDFIKETAQTLKRDFSAFSSPYFFTHINAQTIDGLPVRIIEDVRVAGSWLITSPTELLKALQN